MNQSETIITELGENPYDFFWVLTKDNPNQYLNLEIQNKLWIETLVENDPWFIPYSSEANLVVISDNGNLIFEIPEGCLVCTPRDNEFETFKTSPFEFLRDVENMNCEQFPEDLKTK